MFEKTIHRICDVPLAAVFLLSLVSCVYDAEDDDDGSVGGSASAVSIELTMQTRSLQSGGIGPYYEAGSGYENYINVSGGDYRIYFFTYDPDDPTDTEKNNKFITRFFPGDFTGVAGSSYTQYNVSGEVDAALLEHENFKVVVCANWGGSYTDSPDTIDDLCNAATATFDHLTDFELSPKNLISFYGVREYEGVTFKDGIATVLGEPITLLRAMAKVEVILEPDDSDDESKFDYVKICRYNEKGYCAPSEVYLHNDYDHDALSNYGNNQDSSVWGGDYVSGLHLVGGTNDSDNETKTLDFLKVQESDYDNTAYETWAAYLPEYDNMSDEEDYSYIEVRLKSQLATDEPYRIYFAEYVDGETDNGVLKNRYNIQRNNLYRFTVSISKYFRVHVDKWDGEWTNYFDFSSSGSD